MNQANQANEIYNQLMAEEPVLASQVSIEDIKSIMKSNKPRLKEYIKKERAKKRSKGGLTFPYSWYIV